MFKLVAKVKLKDGKKEEFLKVASVLVEESRKEDGNISYGLFQDVKDTDMLSFIEKWKSFEAIQLHEEASHFKNPTGEISKLGISIEMSIYTAVI